MALTTLATVKEWIPVTGTADDAMLMRLIDAASAFVVSYLGRQIESATFVEKLDGTGHYYVQTATHYPIISLSSVKVGAPGSTLVTLSASNYEFDGRYVYLKQGSTVDSYQKFPVGQRNVEVSGTAGYATVPADVVQACVELVALRYKYRGDRLGLQSKALAGETITYFIKDMSDSARTALEPFRNRLPL